MLKQKHVKSIYADLHLLICTIINSIEMIAANFTKVFIFLDWSLKLKLFLIFKL